MSLMKAALIAIGQRFIEITGCPSNAVIARDPNAPRPTPPYVVMGWTALGVYQGEAERIVMEVDGVTVERVKTPRGGTLSIQGYGEVTSDWIEDFKLSLDDTEESRLTESAAGVSIYSSGGMRDITQLVQSALERRYTLDLDVTYYTYKDKEVAPVLDVEFELTFQDPDQPDLTDTINIDTSP